MRWWFALIVGVAVASTPVMTGAQPAETPGLALGGLMQRWPATVTPERTPLLRAPPPAAGFTPRSGALELGLLQERQRFTATPAERLPQYSGQAVILGLDAAAAPADLPLRLRVLGRLVDDRNRLDGASRQMGVHTELAIAGLRLGAAFEREENRAGDEQQRVAASLGYGIGALTTRMGLAYDGADPDDLAEGARDIYSLGADLDLAPNMRLGGDILYRDPREDQDGDTAGVLRFRLQF